MASNDQGCRRTGRIGEREVSTQDDLIMQHILSQKVVFGLAAQGHIPTIERMLAEGKSWQEIGAAIGWCPETAKRHYEWHLNKARGEHRKMSTQDEREAILYAFSVEAKHDRTTFERYLRQYPELSQELTDLLSEIRLDEAAGTNAADSTVRDWSASWQRFRACKPNHFVE